MSVIYLKSGTEASILKQGNSLIEIQKSLYQIASKQYAVNSLTVKDSLEEKQVLSIKLNDSAKTAVPSVLSTYNRSTNSSENTVDRSMLYKASQKIIYEHQKKETIKPSFIEAEKIKNVVDTQEAKKAMSKYPDLKRYYDQLPEIKRQADNIAGDNNQRRFIEGVTSNFINAVVKERFDKPDKIINPKKDKEMER